MEVRRGDCFLGKDDLTSIIDIIGGLREYSDRYVWAVESVLMSIDRKLGILANTLVNRVV